MPPHDGRTKTGQALKSLSGCMEDNSPSAQIVKALVHVTHCTLGTPGYSHSAFTIIYTVSKHFFALWGH